MSGKEIIFYLVLKADFNCKFMSGKIKFILPNIYFTNLYSIRLDALNTKLAQCPDVYSRKMFSAAPTVVCLRVKRVFSFSKRWERFNLRQQKQTRSENRLPCRTT